MINRIMGGIIAILVLVAGWLYHSNNKLDVSLQESQNRVIGLESTITTLTESLENIRKLRKKEDELVKERDNNYQDMDSLILEAKKEIKSKETITIKGNVNDNEKIKKAPSVDDSNQLDPAISRMLNELCERVRGSPCPNP